MAFGAYDSYLPNHPDPIASNNRMTYFSGLNMRGGVWKNNKRPSRIVILRLRQLPVSFTALDKKGSRRESLILLARESCSKFLSPRRASDEERRRCPRRLASRRLRSPKKS